MKSKLWVLFLGFVLFLAPLSRTAAQTQSTEQSKVDQQIAKIRDAISKRVADDKGRVKIKPRSGAEVQGRLTQAGADNFTFTEDKTGQQRTMAYADVERVKGRGGLSTGAKIGIIVGIAATVVVVAGLISFHNFDPFRNGVLR